MAGLHNDRRTYTGPTIEDCDKLWTTINKELITDCEIQLILRILPLGQVRPHIVVRSPGLDAETGGSMWHVWATKELQASGVAFSYEQLYDLLIMAYRKIDAHLNGQVPMPLP